MLNIESNVFCDKRKLYFKDKHFFLTFKLFLSLLYYTANSFNHKNQAGRLVNIKNNTKKLLDVT